MPLSPKEIAAEREKFTQGELNRLHTRIDASLMHKKFVFVIPDDIEERFVAEVIKGYTHAGWVVARNEDNILEPKLVFSEPAK